MRKPVTKGLREVIFIIMVELGIVELRKRLHFDGELLIKKTNLIARSPIALSVSGKSWL
ncbi:MAG: hypothetical protein IPF67_12135 [Saprospiraceae bacterium]|nr:hypothetical protein [Candidatus Brachybacter algidus]